MKAEMHPSSSIPQYLQTKSTAAVTHIDIHTIIYSEH